MVVQKAQILHLLAELQQEFNAAMILITHDLGVVARVADKVAVMYAGRVIEQGSVDVVLSNPQHPYTRGLIDCVPHLEAEPSPVREELLEIPGVVPALTQLGSGCAFAPRCNRVMDECGRKVPELAATEHGHRAACWAVAAGGDQ